MDVKTTEIPLPTPLRLALVVVPVAALAVVLSRSGAEMPAWAVVAAFAVPVLAIGVALSMRHSVTVEGRDLILRFRPLLTRRIPVGQVVRVEMVDRVHPLRYGGWGLRRAPGNVLAFVNRAGPALRVETADGRTSLVVLASARETDELRRHLESALGLAVTTQPR